MGAILRDKVQIRLEIDPDFYDELLLYLSIESVLSGRHTSANKTYIRHMKRWMAECRLIPAFAEHLAAVGGGDGKIEGISDKVVAILLKDAKRGLAPEPILKRASFAAGRQVSWLELLRAWGEIPQSPDLLIQKRANGYCQADGCKKMAFGMRRVYCSKPCADRMLNRKQLVRDDLRKVRMRNGWTERRKMVAKLAGKKPAEQTPPPAAPSA